MKKAKMHSPDLTQGNIAKIREIFPGCVTVAEDESGEVRLVVDFDQLRQELSDHVVEGTQERYRLDWPGKREALAKANEPITKTLRPCREESVDFDTTENLFIEGDNLEALKLIQESYLKKIKLIYIDPPYNTGRNLIYKNDYSSTEEDFLRQSGQIDESNGRLVANTEAHGRFHSDWLSMMYARLKIAKNLLRPDGVLVCAIDENEFPTLVMIIQEIFGGGGFKFGYVSIMHNPRGQQGMNFSYVNEYLIFVYVDDNIKHLADFKKEKIDSRNLRDSGGESDRTNARNCFYPFLVKDGKIIDIGDVPNDNFHPSSANIEKENGLIEIWPMTDSGDEKKWRYARNSVEAILDNLEPKMGRSSVQVIFHKDRGTMRSVWAGARYDSSEYGTKLLEEMIPNTSFTYPKSLWAVYDCIFAGTENHKDAIVLDFFAGSSTTAHATMKLNADDGGNRSFIMVQFPEEISESNNFANEKFKTISDISKERIRRSGKKVLQDKCHPDWNKDIGFRVLKIDTSNLHDVYYQPDQVAQSTLLDSVDNIKSDRTPEDLLFQVLVDWGVDLTLPIREETLQGKPVFFVDDNALAACFDRDITEDFIKELAKREPIRAVFRDSGYASDAVKVNVEQIFLQISSSTEVKAI